jgi:tol-pal system protein YbgF
MVERKKFVLLAVAALVVAALLCPAPAAAQKKEIAQLQRDVDLLRETVRELQRSVDEKHAVLRTLIEQALDAVNKLNTTMGGLQKSVQDVQANSGARMDSMSTQVQALADNLEEVKVRLAKLSQQMAEIQGVVQSLDAKVAGGAPMPGATTPAAPPPPPGVLYDNALRDFTSGKYDLAGQEFQDYLKYYPDTDVTSNAQFYLGEILYAQKKYSEAIPEYDKVLDNYPRSFKLAAARLKKGLALLELGQRTSALRELREVVRRHPGTDESRRANAKLRELGAAPPGKQG